MTTAAIDNSILALRALIAEDWDTFHRLHAAHNAEERQAFALVLTTASAKAAIERFGEHPRSEDVIDFVADARVRMVGPEALVPEDAERVIRAALGEPDLIKDMDGRALGTAQTSLLFAFANENDTSAEMVTKALAEAGEEVADYLARRKKR